MIKLSNISMNYKEKVIFKDMNFTFFSHINYIQGDNATGKTTLLNIISGKEKHFSGQVNLGNIKNISYISQENQLIDDLNFKENIEIICPNYDKQRLEYLLTNFGIMHKYKSKTKVSKLSGGEKKKLHIILGLLKDFDLLILDEIDNHIDNASIEIIIKFILSTDAYIIISSHSLDDYMDNIEYSVIAIENKQLKYIKQTNEYVKETFSEKTNKLLNKYSIKKLSKIGRLTRFVLILFIIIMGLFVSVISYFKMNDLFVSLQMHHTTLKYDEDASILYPPAFSESFPYFHDENQLVNTKLFLTQNDLDYIKNLSYVKDVKPIPLTNSYVDSDIFTFDGNAYSLLPIKINGSLENYHFSHLRIPKGIQDKVPLIEFLPFEDLMYGSIPKDESNEILIDDAYANYLIQDLKIDSIEELIGKEVNIKANSNNKEEEIIFKVAGIYKLINPANKNIYVSYKYDATFYNETQVQQILPDTETAKFTFDTFITDYPNTKEALLNYFDNNQTYYYGFFIEFKNNNSLEAFTKEMRSKDPYLDIKNDYAIRHYPIFLYIKKILFKAVISLVILIITLVIINLLCFKYYLTKIEPIKQKLLFHGFNNTEIIKYTNKLRMKYNLYYFFSLVLSSILLSIYLTPYKQGISSVEILIMFVYLFTFILVIIINKFTTNKKEKNEFIKNINK